MKRRRLSAETLPRPPPPSPWRWAIGGPITDFGEDGIEVGPSCAPYTPEVDDADRLTTTACCSECCWESEQPSRITQASSSGRSRASTRGADLSSLGHPRPPPRSSDPLLLDHQPLQNPHSLSSHSSSTSPTPSSRRRRRLRTLPTLTTALALAAAFTPLAAAGPLPSVTPTSVATRIETIPIPAATPTPPPLRPRRFDINPEYLLPSSLPSVNTISLPETVLPYYLTQSSDGLWYKVENAWWLYGRVIEGRDEPPSSTTSLTDPSATTTSGSYAVISVLPRGWGVSNPRSSFYKTPLIVTASVILALLIVAGIIFITFQRRKIARRRKRHAARMRRKALAAAGLTEDDVRQGGEDAERKVKEHFEEFERQYAIKRRSRGKMHHQTTFVRTKVRVWHKGVRKRRTGAVERDDDEKAETNGFSSAHVLGGRASVASSFTASQTSLGSSISSRSVDSDHSRGHSRHRRPSPTDAAPPEPTEDSSERTPETVVNSDMPSSPTSLTSNARSSMQPPASSQSPSSPEAAPQSSSSDPGGSEPRYPHLPPAYRPASIHSGQGEASSSSAAPGMRNVAAAAEKVAASGFYPAPATAEAEQAQMVAHRADAKAPITIPPEDEERRARHHVATDDKRELERMRLGASAPPVVRQDGDAGPSAPRFEVDDAGFEVLPEEDMSNETVPSPTAPGIPLPPAPVRLTSLRTFDAHSSEDQPLVGSAPPTVSSPVDAPVLPPSAPPWDGDAEDDVPSAPPSHASAPPIAVPSAPPPDNDDEMDTSPSSTGPSAPPLDEFDHDEELVPETPGEPDDEHTPGSASQTPGNDGAATSQTAGDMRANLGVNGHRFLPRYEP